MIKPGDEVNILPGTYRLKDQNVCLQFSPKHSGTEDKPIVFRAYDGNDKPVIVAGGDKSWNGLKITASYLIFDGIEFKGIGETLDSLDARTGAQYFWDHPEERGTYIGKLSKFNTNGVSVGGDANYVSHHVTIRNCIVHDFPGGGLGASECDYITFENNLVYNNAWYCMYACSGISVVHPVDCDAETGYKIIIRGNRVFNNKTMIPWFHNDTFEYSDGNGIIIDINDGSFGSIVYNGRTLVCNNLSVYNGGSGIHAFGADHVDIVNNTSCYNGRKYSQGKYPDIDAHACEDVNIVNNIMCALPAGACNNAAEHLVTYENNLMFGGRYYEHAGSKVGDPLFVNPSTDWQTADYHIKAGSPAIGMGISKSFIPDTDIEGDSRDGKLDVGAYIYK